MSLAVTLTQKFFAFLLLIIIPLGLAIVFITQDSEDLIGSITERIDRLERKFTADIVASSDALIHASSQAVDELTQINAERLTNYVAQSIADFLYERDADTLFLAKALSEINDPETDDPQSLIRNFRQTQTALVTITPRSPKPAPSHSDKAKHEENANMFRYSHAEPIAKTKLPLYKEITFLDLSGEELAKSSSLNENKRNVAQKANTYLNAETYFTHLKNLKEGDIYVSEVVGAYVPTEAAYSGAENPLGKRFEGIIRFATPVYKNEKPIGYITLALAHRHLMEFTDYITPENAGFKTNIKDASDGNYASMWYYKGRNIAHPREYFISGVDPQSGERIPPWISADLAKQFKRSGATSLNSWLETQIPYHEQSRSKEPNPAQVQSGYVPLDCRYLDFAPQCAGWNQILRGGGYGSFLVYWSGIWKLTAVAPIPYFSPYFTQGFGFVTISTNIGEFASTGIAAQEVLKENIGQVNSSISAEIRSIGKGTREALIGFRSQLVTIGAVLLGVVLVVVMVASLNMKRRVAELLAGAEAFAKGDLEARITTTSRDEIGVIARSFNTMAEALSLSHQELEKMITQRTDELRHSNQLISDSIDYASRIQRNMLPSNSDLKQHFSEIEIIWQPKDVVGGDFYWHGQMGEYDLLVVMDCTGHGGPGALMTLIASSVLEQITTKNVTKKPSLAEMMQQLHEGVKLQLAESDEPALAAEGLDALMVLIPKHAKKLYFCGASIDLYSVSDNLKVKRHRGDKVSLGYASSDTRLALTEQCVKVDGKTCFVITTDGILTQPGEKIKRSYGYRQFIQTLSASPSNTPQALRRSVMRSFRAWQGSEVRRDDITLIVFKPKNPT